MYIHYRIIYLSIINKSNHSFCKGWVTSPCDFDKQINGMWLQQLAPQLAWSVSKNLIEIEHFKDVSNATTQSFVNFDWLLLTLNTPWPHFNEGVALM